MSKKVKFIKNFKIPIFNITVSVFQGQNKPNYDAYVYVDKGTIKSVFRKNCSDDVVVHECVHISNFVHRLIGANTSVKNDEVQAYLTQYIYKKVKKILCKKS